MSVCTPCVLIVSTSLGFAAVATPPSSDHMIALMPESASLPVSVTAALRCCQAVGKVVVSFGAVWSTWMLVKFSAAVLPAESTARVSSVCVPVPLMTALPPVVQLAAPSILCSPCAGETLSPTCSVTEYGPACHPPGTTVPLVGVVLSIWTVSSTQSLQTPDCARCVNVWVPLVLTIAVPPLTPALVEPQSSFHSKFVPVPASAMFTGPVVQAGFTVIASVPATANGGVPAPQMVVAAN